MTDRARVPKLVGADVELGNFVIGVDQQGGTGAIASRALLREIEGLPRTAPAAWAGARYDDRENSEATCGSGYVYRSGSRHLANHAGGYDVQDWGRKFLPMGSCAYIDLDHLEVCPMETLTARDHLASWYAMLRVARKALAAANARQPAGRRIQVLVNNSDGAGNSYGSHLNLLTTRRAWDNIFHRRLQFLLYLASFQVSSIVFTGQGKVGSENGRPPVTFQLSQRADFLETLAAPWTTYRRPIVNSRDEALCGTRWGASGRHDEAAENLARLHVIFFDSTLCHVASFLRVGVMQVVLSMIEAERIDRDLILDDPLEAVVGWSHDPTLRATARTESGRDLTAVELQWLFLEQAKRFVADGGCEGTVPEVNEIMALWESTLTLLETRDLEKLARRVDWALKLSILERALGQRPRLTWTSPEIKHLDLVYASLDATEGLYWAYERGGFVERLVSDEHIDRLGHEPVADTRAWARTMLLRRAGPDAVDDVTWDRVRLRIRGRTGWTTSRTVDFANPLAWTRRETEPIFEHAADLDEILDGLEALQPHGRIVDPMADGALIVKEEDVHETR